MGVIFLKLSEKLIRSFSDIIKSSSHKDKKQNPTVMGTVNIVDNSITVMIDGSDIRTPATTLVDVEHGDRVDVLIQNHRAIITGNRSAPAITRYGKSYTKLTEEGLVVGLLGDDDEPVGGYLLVNPNTGAFEVIDPDGNALASFGETTTIGLEGDNRVIIQSDGVHLWGDGLDASIARFGTDMINGVQTPIIRLGLLGDMRMKFSPTKIQLIDGSTTPATVLAEFGTKSLVQRLETDGLLVTGLPNTFARIAVQGFDSSNVKNSEIWLMASPSSGRSGLYDGTRNKWIIDLESDGSIQSHTTPAVLNSTTYTATTISETSYVNVPIANLSTWSLIVVYYRCGNEFGSVEFVQGGRTYHRICYYGSNRQVVIQIDVEWANNRLRLSCRNGNSGDERYCSIMQVYGIFKV